MPSSQTPPAGATALDPTAVRPDIADARILRVTPDDVRGTLEGLRAGGFTMLLDLGAVDYLGREPARFDVVYHLLRLPERVTGVDEIGTPERVRVLCGVRADATTVPTVSDLWASADWAEREVYDLFGITFSGHPDLRRIQMPDDWEGHPLRKDYPLRGVARERTPRPSFALKSNVAAGTPAAGRTAAGLQKQIAEVRRQADAQTLAEGAAAAQSGTNPGGAVTAAAATPGQLGAQPVNLKTEDGKPQ